MKLTFTPPRDGRSHTYCLRCQGEIDSRKPAAGTPHRCPACGHGEDRALIIDPTVEWWTAEDDEYWHEVVGVFLGNGRGEYLFFERTRFPYGLTVPAGHRDRGESRRRGASRELREETGIAVSDLALLGTDEVVGDQCRRGADAHLWHSFIGRLPEGANVTVDSSEGKAPVWLTPETALSRELTFATRYVLTRHIAALRHK